MNGQVKAERKMFGTSSFRMWRLTLGALFLLGVLACQTNSCSCVAPLHAPMDGADQIFDSVQLRLTPATFDFMETNLPQLLASAIPGGLEFAVPPTHQDFDAGLFTMSLDICQDGCTLSADIQEASLSRIEPNILHLDSFLDLTGTIYIDGDVECDVPIHIQHKPLNADVNLLINESDKLMSFGVTGLDITMDDDDYTLECHGLLGPIIEALKSVITDMMNEQIGSQLDDAISSMLLDSSCLSCDFYTNGCPAGSSCDEDVSKCLQDSNGRCLSNPLGVVGTVNMADLLGGAIPSTDANLDVFLAVGQQLDAAADPVIVNDGMELRMIGGASGQNSSCVPVPDPDEIPSTAPPERLSFNADDTVPGSDVPFMIGLGLSEVYLDWAVYKAYLSGAFCLTLDTQSTGGMLSTGTMGALMGSLSTLTAGANTPMKLQLRPQHVPDIRIGAGTFTVDADGNKVIDDPLITLVMPETAMDFYAMLNDRWVRLVTLTQDVSILIGLEFLPDNRVLPVFDENSIVLGDVTASNYEVLAEDPDALSNLVPTLLGLALPLLTDSLAVIDLPPVQGFSLNIVSVGGQLPRQDNDGFEYLSIYSNLDMVQTRSFATVEPAINKFRLITPGRTLMDMHNLPGPLYPELVLTVHSQTVPPAEFSWRLDHGVWSVFQPGPVLHVKSPVLALEGPHTVEVQARLVGQYRSLSAEPVLRNFVIKPGLKHSGVPRRIHGDEHDPVALDDNRLNGMLNDSGSAPQDITPGCATAPDTSGLQLWMILLGLWFMKSARRH